MFLYSSAAVDAYRSLACLFEFPLLRLSSFNSLADMMCIYLVLHGKYTTRSYSVYIVFELESSTAAVTLQARIPSLDVV